MTPVSPVFSGAKAAAVEVEPVARYIDWSLDLLASQTVASQSAARQGFVALRFTFHPGNLETPSIPVFTLYIDGLGLDLIQTSHQYQLDFKRRQWQVIEIPFEAFDQINYYYGIEPLAQVNVIDLIRIKGNLTGTFYLDDVRLVTGTPPVTSTPPITGTLVTGVPYKTSIKAYSWG